VTTTSSHRVDLESPDEDDLITTPAPEVRELSEGESLAIEHLLSAASTCGTGRAESGFTAGTNEPVH
jgi:hypothetical protein